MESNIKRNTFSILFYIVRSKKNNNGEHPIYCRVTVQGKSREFSTQQWTLDKKWNPKAAKVIGNTEAARTLNYFLDAIRNSLHNIRTQLTEEVKPISALAICNTHLGKGERKLTVMQLYKHYIDDRIKPLLGKEYAQGTYDRYQVSSDHTLRFLKFHFKVDDLPVSELNLGFASKYEFYLKTERNCAHNTTLKYIRNLKTVINYGIGLGWLTYNPLAPYKASLKRVVKEFLTEDEITKIRNKEFLSDRMMEIRDVFIFCCYTGLAYSDVEKLTSDNVLIDMKGNKLIKVNRTKSKTLSQIPLLDPAIEILSKYEDHIVCKNKNRLLPVKSNQKHNEYLKEIATICNINKKLTTHTARHTFATLMLTLGGTTESLMSMLGHTNMSTTQIYAKIIPQKVNKEMVDINAKLSVNIA